MELYNSFTQYNSYDYSAHKNVLSKDIEKNHYSSFWDILHFILAYFDLKKEMSHKLFFGNYILIFLYTG